MSKPPRTVTSPEILRKWFEGPDPVTALRAWSASIGNNEHPLALDQLSFECGAHPSCHVSINDPHVSQRHAHLERRGWRLKVTDLQSKNGTFLHGSSDGKREPVFDVGPGQIFGLARSVTVLPMNEEMRASRRRFVEILGIDQPQLTPDALLIEAMGSGNIAVVGEAGCGHEQLARAIHAVSIRRTLKPIEIDEVPADQMKLLELVTRAMRSTLIIKCRSQPRANRASLELITSAQYQIRVIAIAPTIESATKALGVEITGRMRTVLLRPLRTRLAELDQMFDQMVSERASTLRMHHLSAQHQDVLRSYAWPGNFAELAAAVDRIAALVPSPSRPVSVKAAATALGISDSWFYEWLEKMSLSKFWESLTPGSPAPSVQ